MDALPIRSVFRLLVGLGVALFATVLALALARVAVPRAVDRLGARYGWSANGRSVLTAVGIGATATVGVVLAVQTLGFDRFAGPALALGGVVTGVGVERRRVRTVSPVLEALGVLAALVALAILTAVVGNLLGVAGAFVAAAALGGLGHAGVNTLTRSPPDPVGPGTPGNQTQPADSADSAGANGDRDRRRR